jgi:outer membrane protein assembly factor BamB
LHPLVPVKARQSRHQMVWNGKGEPGILLGGRGINNSGYDYPRAAKISALDGRVLWRWETDRRVRGNVASAMSDAQGNVIVAGTNGWDSPPLLLAKLDGASGTPIWEASAVEQRPALDAVLGGDGNVVLVLGADDADPDSPIHVAKYSATDGSPIWSVPVAQNHEAEVGEQRIAAHVDGSVLVLSRFVDPGLGQNGMQVARFASNDGVLTWSRRLPGTTSSSGIALLSLPNADVIVADSNLVWRLDGATGTVLWQKTMPYLMSSLILDGQGQILACGSQDNLRTVSRLNSSNGTALWTRQLPLSGTQSNSESASVLSLSADGNIFVGGGDGIGHDTLAKITMLNGATIWQVATATSNESAGITIFPVGIVEAPDRNVFISGLAMPDPLSWTLDKVTGPFADGIFASGYE